MPAGDCVSSGAKSSARRGGFMPSIHYKSGGSWSEIASVGGAGVTELLGSAGASALNAGGTLSIGSATWPAGMNRNNYDTFGISWGFTQDDIQETVWFRRNQLTAKAAAAGLYMLTASGTTTYLYSVDTAGPTIALRGSATPSPAPGATHLTGIAIGYDGSKVWALLEWWQTGVTTRWRLYEVNVGTGALTPSGAAFNRPGGFRNLSSLATSGTQLYVAGDSHTNLQVAHATFAPATRTVGTPVNSVVAEGLHPGFAISGTTVYWADRNSAGTMTRIYNGTVGASGVALLGNNTTIGNDDSAGLEFWNGILYAFIPDNVNNGRLYTASTSNGALTLRGQLSPVRSNNSVLDMAAVSDKTRTAYYQLNTSGANDLELTGIVSGYIHAILAA